MDHKHFNFVFVLLSHPKYATPNLDTSSVCCSEGVGEGRGEGGLQNSILVLGVSLNNGLFCQKTITMQRCHFDEGPLSPEDCIETTSCRGSECCGCWNSSE